MLEIPLAAAAVAIGVTKASIVAPGIVGIRASPCGIFPFRLCQKPILLASQPRQPTDILLGVVLADVEHWHLRAPPMVWHSRASSRGDANVPFLERHLELGNCEWPPERHLVLRAFIGSSVWLGLR